MASAADPHRENGSTTDGRGSLSIVTTVTEHENDAEETTSTRPVGKSTEHVELADVEFGCLQLEDIVSVGIRPADVELVDAVPAGDGKGLTRAASRASSTAPRPLAVVPRANRRGLCSRFSIVPEVERPYDYKASTKWGITATIALAGMAAPMGSAIFYPSLPQLTKDLDTTETVTNLSVAMYMLSMSIFPLWWSSFSEEFGRRTIYLVSFTLFVITSALCAVSTSITMLIIFRILTGGASASVQSVGAGTIADIWQPRERGRAMSTFYLGPLLGPMIAPILGGFLAQKMGWRSTMYFLTIYGGVVLILLFFLLPETLPRPVSSPGARMQPTMNQAATSHAATQDDAATGHAAPQSASKSAKERAVHIARLMGRFFIEPLRVLAFLRLPPVLITSLVAAVAFGALFVVNISIQNRFSQSPYNYTQLIVGLLYIPSGLGYFVAALFGGQWLDSIMAREARRANRYDEKGRLVYLPEDRIRENMWLAISLYPIGMLLFGWTLQYGVFWFVPSIGNFLFGVASMLVFSAATTMLTEFVHSRSSTGVAVNNFLRNILSCVCTVVAAPWVNAMGPGWVFTILAIFCVFSSVVGVWVLRRNAKRWRKDMDLVLSLMK